MKDNRNKRNNTYNGTVKLLAVLFLCVNVDNMIVFFRYNANSSFVRENTIFKRNKNDPKGLPFYYFPDFLFSKKLLFFPKMFIFASSLVLAKQATRGSNEP